MNWISEYNKNMRKEKKIYLDPKQWIIIGSKPKKYVLSEKITRYGTSISQVEETTKDELDSGDFGSWQHWMKVEKILPMSKTDEKIYWNYDQCFECRFCKSYELGAMYAKDHVCEERKK